MDSQKKQVADRLKQAENVLITVSSNPSVDQLAAAIGMTLLLNRLGKHATAVFSGQIPNTIQFLQPEKTLEKTTDSLRDFIIALDKSKADKLRYKVEDQMVKIFITPYRTSISDKDLVFSQGDFNVDVVVALGVNEQQDLDQAITAHGRILHDATVMSINTKEGASLGSINWVQPDASSLCEMLLDVGLTLKADVLDSQMATAFLTGIVAETDRFGNEKTHSASMQFSAKLIAAGANQQLVASQLEPPAPVPADIPVKEEPAAELPEVPEESAAAAPAEVVPKPADDGSLEVKHEDQNPPVDLDSLSEDEEPLEQIDIDKEGRLKRQKEIEEMKQKVVEPLPEEDTTKESPSSRPIMRQPPTAGLSGTLTANSKPEALDPSVDPLAGGSKEGPLLSHDTSHQTSSTSDDQPSKPTTDTTTTPKQDEPTSTLSDLEESVDSPHISQANPVAAEPEEGLDAARSAVTQAVSSTPPQVLEPVQSLNAQPIDLGTHYIPEPVPPPVGGVQDGAMVDPSLLSPPSSQNPEPTPQSDLPTNLVPPDPGLPADNTAGSVSDPTAPPPVPPPMMPPAMPPADTPPK